MYYEINVSKKEAKLDWQGNPSYRHLFATAKRSCTNIWECNKVLKDLEEHGYNAPEYLLSVSLDMEQSTSWSVKGFKESEDFVNNIKSHSI